jgi:serine/threonine protein phosphatase PrpC
MSGIKRGHNEDNYLINEELNLFVVADGMGGHAGGEYASALAVNTVEEIVTSLEVDGVEVSDATDPVEITRHKLSHSIRFAGRRIFEKAREQPEYHGMGTTCGGGAGRGVERVRGARGRQPGVPVFARARSSR